VRVISGFRREVDDISDLPGYYAADSGNSLPTATTFWCKPYNSDTRFIWILRWNYLLLTLLHPL